MIRKNKISGLTLIETLVAITVMTSLMAGFVYFVNGINNQNKETRTANEIASIIDGVGKRLEVDYFLFDNWDKNEWKGNEEVFKNLVAKQLRSRDSACGLPDGWDSKTVGIDNFEAVSCNIANVSSLPFGLMTDAKLEKGVINGKDIVSKFNIDVSFKNDKYFDSNFQHLMKMIGQMEYKNDFKSPKRLEMIDFRNNTNVGLYECLDLKSSCGVRFSLDTFAMLPSDRLRVDGSNGMMAQLDFDNSEDSCTVWERDASGNWESTEDDCAIFGGSDSVDDKVLARVNGVDVNERFSLNKTCSFFETEITEDGKEYGLFNTPKNFSCGMIDGKIISLNNNNGNIISTNTSNANSNVHDLLITDNQSSLIMSTTKNAIIDGLLDSDRVDTSRSMRANDVDGKDGSKITTDLIVQVPDATNTNPKTEFYSEKFTMLDNGKTINGSFVRVDNLLKINSSYSSDLTKTNQANIRHLRNDIKQTNSLNPATKNPFSIKDLGIVGVDTAVRVQTMSEELKKYLNANAPERQRSVEVSKLNKSITVPSFHSGKNGKNIGYDAGGVNQYGITEIKETSLENAELNITETGKTKERLVVEYRNLFSSTNPLPVELNIVREGLSLTSDDGSLLKSSGLNIHGAKTDVNYNKNWDNNIKNDGNISSPQLFVSNNLKAGNQINVNKVGRTIMYARNGDVWMDAGGRYAIGGGHTGGFLSGILNTHGETRSSKLNNNPSTTIDFEPYFNGSLLIDKNLTIDAAYVTQHVPFFRNNSTHTARGICNYNIVSGAREACLTDIYVRDRTTYNEYLVTLKHQERFANIQKEINQDSINKRGDQGEKGLQGEKGNKGIDGNKGNVGPKGPMAYNYRS